MLVHMFNINSKSRYLCFVPDLSGNSFSFSPCWLWVCHIWPLWCWGRFPLCPLSEGFFFFYQKWVLDFVKGFFCVYWEDHMVFILQFVNVVYHTDGFAEADFLSVLLLTTWLHNVSRLLFFLFFHKYFTIVLI